MKIVTVAAGLGSRLRQSALETGENSQNFDLPKPLFPLLDNPIAHWSIKSFEHWITTGLVTPSDLVFVVQKEHIEKFSIDTKLREYIHPDLTIVVIDGLTKGPAETALLGLSLIQESEPIIINDCDHHFQAASLQRLIRRMCKETNKNQLALACTNTRSTIPSWSYLELEDSGTFDSRKVLEIREKDYELMRRGAKGVIGTYFFSSRKLFQDIYQSTFQEASGEYFISRMVQEAISQGIEVLAAESEYGYPLGNILEIRQFEKQVLKKQVRFQSESFFYDIDGVIIEHDAGYHSRIGRYDYDSREISENISKIRQQYIFGGLICLTTARPEEERKPLEDYLHKVGVPYDQLVMGLNPGKRILINDRKRTSPSVDSAVATSNIRNEKLPDDEYNMHCRFPIVEHLTGGSGVETLRLSSLHLGTFIRKCVPNLPEFQRHSSILNLQAEWYHRVSQANPGIVPKVHFSGLDSGFSVLDLEDIGNVPNLSQAIQNSQSDMAVKIIEDLLSTLNQVYLPYLEKHTESRQTAISNRNFLIYEKAIPGINSLRSRSNSEVLSAIQAEVIEINGKKLPNPVGKLKHIAENRKDLLGYSSQFKTLIHGDLTFENILTRAGKPLLIDPLGAFMDPKMQANPKTFLERVSPMWDLIKLLQSEVLEYEKWNYESGILNSDSSGRFWIESKPNERMDGRVASRIINHYSDFGLDLSHANLNLMLSILLFRLIPYKIGVSIEKAMYCWVLGTLLLEDV
jgi:NDP-sugar pyrophosphorylase family protein